ncbi:Outer membrane protein beta-barrel domain-containing protein [Lutibacter agarilyticus]|uniref:Outer membrane protein beta-barrel domain-containing protein n=1 Tax=Lutibacter agarilyticus TaxID=1109740 RepID=A0A238VHG2_9FLAO|nr:outer membrane beta-barrel protein [Lutibacter agarilyticus]SNR33631.1 Outer membrane protein beta-barrel domain-containing protein [Lutibacter agarilyticus]
MIKKSSALLVILIITLTSLNAQSSWGVKGSLLYNSNGELINEAGDIIDNKGKGESGFNVGVYGKLDLGPIYIRPELVYSQSSSKYTVDSEIGTTESYKMSSVDLPVLVGIRIIGPLNLLAGPAFKFITSNKVNGFEYDKIENGVTVGLNIGVSANLGRFGFDVIYDRGINANEANFIGDDIADDFTLDTRQSQIRVGVSYRLSEKK